MRPGSSFAKLVFVVILGVGVALSFAIYGISASWESNWLIIPAIFLATVVSFAIKVADQWNRAVVLRLGRFRSLEGPGLFFIIPIVETVAYWIDTRVITSAFKAEKTLTKDTVPVDVDAVLFWKVVDPKKAALTLPTTSAPSIGRHKRRCATSSARPCFRTCWKAGTRSATSCRRSSMCGPSPGASMSFLWRSRTC